ncbi:NADH-quinone oxidoreductase subunit C [Nitrosophilus alvini]|uniref:NADH-quinone oxidoreductase subunit C n=1 Tax=Nitrosophilus alvini TaxID=2714855 RepID=UPI00190C37F1|nr:NADH-quinone oxidoreductase subunit C [Nitrosophilus alvini]
MRPYKPKDNVQAKAYYTDRFWVAPKIPEEDVQNDEVYAEDLKKLEENFEIKKAYIQRGQLVVCIAPEINKEVVKFFKDELEYDFLSELSAIDYLAQDGEFEIFYQMLSTSKRKRARIKCRIKENQAIESVESVFRSANWSEREMYDMFGVKVNNHPYMKRILMPDDWSGHPLRKTYPLHGDEAAQWYEVDKIFGKEYREIIGPEIRDAAFVDRYDTERFARLGHEVPRGAPVDYKEQGNPDVFNDDAPLVETFDMKKSKIVNRDR